MQSGSAIEIHRPHSITRICPADETHNAPTSPSTASPDGPPWGVPIIQQTGRRKKDGFIVWTLFHELGRILNVGDRSTSVELDGQKSDELSEKGADEFARRELFGPEGLGSFRGLTRKADIVRVAKAVGVSPGVAVNEMHRKRMLDYGWCNDLLVDVEIPMAV